MSEQANNLMPCPACGRVHCVAVDHYDRIQTECGAKWFVIRPKRFGPLRLVPHPGLPLTRWERAEKEAAEKLASGGLTT